MISVVISAYNEEENIKECIDSVQELADEIIVVDNSSTDRTGEIAKKAGAKVFTQPNNPEKIDLQKNFGFERASHEWILSLDADERVNVRLIQEIKKVIADTNGINGYLIPRKNILFGKWIKNSIWWPDYQLRLFKRGKGKFSRATVHQPLDVKGDTKHLSEPLVHYNYDSVSEFVSRMNNIYTEIEAEEILRQKQKLAWTDALSMPASDFLKTFFLQKGYRDGLHGLILSILQAFYMFLVFAKVWERQGFYEKDSNAVLKGVGVEFKKISQDGTFWLWKSFENETRNPLKKLLYKISRRFLR